MRPHVNASSHLFIQVDGVPILDGSMEELITDNNTRAWLLFFSGWIYGAVEYRGRSSIAPVTSM